MIDQQSPVKTRQERKKEETRQKIVSTAMQLFQQVGYEATTMEQISAAADVAKGTLYNYFPVKEAILGAFIQRSFSQHSAERMERLHALPDTRARMNYLLAEMLPKTAAQKLILEKFLVYRVQNILSLHKTEGEKSGVELLSAEIISLGQKAGEIRTDLPAGMLEDQFEFVFVEIFKQITQEPENQDITALIEHCVDLYINGAKKEKNQLRGKWQVSKASS